MRQFQGVQGKARGRARRPRDPRIARTVAFYHFLIPLKDIRNSQKKTWRTRKPLRTL